jgi:hypothetical protein
MTYHGGPVMIYPQIYTIFWIPSQLQNAGSTGFSPQYALLQILNAAYLPSHGLLNIATQYYQTSGGTTSYIQNFGYWAGYAVDPIPSQRLAARIRRHQATASPMRSFAPRSRMS